MYNYSTTLRYREYDNDTFYRKELLDCFNQTGYDDDISKIIDQLYNKYREKYNNILSSLKDTGNILFTSLPNSSLFMVLFSWDYWFENHIYLQSLQKGDVNEINLRENELLNKIVGLGK